MKNRQLLLDNLMISVSAIRTNGLRTVLTILIIAIGITALIGILTAIDALNGSITSNFAQMGSNTFVLQSKNMRARMGGHRQMRQRNDPQISFVEAMQFKRKYAFPATVGLSVSVSGNAVVKCLDQKTNPNVNVMGIDENFFLTAGGDLAQGRNFTELEALSGQHLAVIGSEIRTKVMPTVRKPVGQYITVDGVKFLVIGVLVEKGSSFNSGDRGVYVPLQTARQYFGTGTLDFRINVMPTDFTLQASAVDEAEGTFRMIRRLGFGDDSDFELSESDSLSKMLIGNLSKVSLAATFIGIITLIGAAIGLMNIMLVAVAERTREIGTRKAIGAKASTIKQQFLFESIIIGQLGGFLGIVFGVGIGNLIALSLGSSFIIPWLWIFMGVMVCFVVGIASGIIPAIKASKLDPIDALRYE